jgi:hypothetical protein
MLKVKFLFSLLFFITYLPTYAQRWYGVGVSGGDTKNGFFIAMFLVGIIAFFAYRQEKNRSNKRK